MTPCVLVPALLLRNLQLHQSQRPHRIQLVLLHGSAKSDSLPIQDLLHNTMDLHYATAARQPCAQR